MAVIISSFLLWVGVVLLSISVDVGGLVSLSVSVPLCHPHVHQQGNQSDGDIHQVVVKPTANGWHGVLSIVHCKWYNNKSSKNLVETFDGVEQAYEQPLHGVRTLGADELKHSNVNEHVGES